ncbi:MAG: methylglyoxal synthase [Rhodobacteraceae bacterium]|nr:methylglyoxal synthase [Paracoccaceae bacterium]
MDQNTLVKTLQNEGNLKYSFSGNEIEDLCQWMTIETFKQTETLISKGSPADSLVFILSGLAQSLDDNRQVALHNKGDFTGDSLFSDRSTHNVNVQALEDSVTARLSCHDFHEFLQKDQTLALKYQEFFHAISKVRGEQIAGERFVDKKKYLALIAHNNMKSSLMEFCSLQSKKLEQFPLIATGTTGSLLFKKTGLMLSRKVASGPLGGDQAVGTMISTKNVCGVIFFRDPLSAHPHHADIEALGRLCDVYQIPFATNPQSGEAILDYLLSGKGERELIPNHVLEVYKQGQSKVVEAS